MDRPEDVHAVGLQAERPDGHDGDDHPDERTGHSPADALAGDHDGEHGEREPQRPHVRVAELAHQALHPAGRRRAAAREPQDGGELADEDLDGDAGQDARDDGSRDEVGDPSEPQQAHGDEDDADDEGEERDEVQVLGGAHRGNRRDPAGEHRGDGRVGTHGEVTARTEQGDHERARHERVQTGDRRHVRQAGGGHLLGDGDGDEGQARDEVRPQPGDPVAAQGRGQQGDGRAPRTWIILAPPVSHGGQTTPGLPCLDSARPRRSA